MQKRSEDCYINKAGGYGYNYDSMWRVILTHSLELKKAGRKTFRP